MTATVLIALTAAALVAALARFRRRSWIGWGLAALAVCVVGEIPIRFLTLLADPTLTADASGRVGLAVTTYGFFAAVLALILLALPRRAG